jgi:hypothetical protein
MARTHSKHQRVYVDGVDLSGYSRQIGALSWMFSAEPDMAFTDGAKNILMGQADIQAGTLNAFFDNDAAGLYNLAKTGTGTRNLLIAIGANAAPVAGNPVFAWQFEQSAYMTEQGSGFVAVTMPFGGASHASTLSYSKPWGVLLHANSAATADNDQTGIDDNGASSALGGVFIYHLLSSDGGVTLKAQHADTNLDGSFADLTGATSGAVDASAAPKSGMVELAATEAIERYLRWQLVFETGTTTATFVSALIRNNL